MGFFETRSVKRKGTIKGVGVCDCTNQRHPTCSVENLGCGLNPKGGWYVITCVKTSKSPKRVMVEALRTAERALEPYSHRFSPKKFTQHQLFARLTLKDFYNLPYRGTVGLLKDSPALCEAIGLEVVPHFTTLQKAADRLLVAPAFRRLLSATVPRAKPLWPAVAGGNSQLDAQTPQRRSGPCPNLLASLPAAALEDPHSQSQHPRQTEVFY